MLDNVIHINGDLSAHSPFDCLISLFILLLLLPICLSLMLTAQEIRAKDKSVIRHFSWRKHAFYSIVVKAQESIIEYVGKIN